MITFAKAVTNGTIPLGGVLVSRDIHAALLSIDVPAHVPELMHGYTYSGHPVAAAVGLATLEVFAQEGLVARAAELAPVLEDAVHSLRGEPGVGDIRNCGLMAAVDFEPIAGHPGLRAFRVFEHGFANSHLFRPTSDTISLAPPFIATRDEIAGVVDGLRAAIRAVRAMPAPPG